MRYAPSSFFLAPLCVFIPILWETKTSGMSMYGILAYDYTKSLPSKMDRGASRRAKSRCSERLTFNH